MSPGRTLDFWLSGVGCCVGLYAVQGGHYLFALFAFAVSALCFYAGANDLP